MTATPVGAERRRSPRIPWRIPVVLTWRPDQRLTVREHAETEVVNAYGASIRLSSALRVGQAVTLVGKGKNISRPARVVANLPVDGSIRVGVELFNPGMEIWTELAR